MLFEAPRRAGLFLRRILPMFVLLAASGLSACSDDDDDPSGPAGSIIGTWTTENGAFYIEITSTTARTFAENGACYVGQEFDIVDEDGDIYTLRPEGSSQTFEAEIRRDGDDLRIDGDLWEASSVDVDDLDICPDLELPACNTLQEIPLSGDLIGDLEATDPLDQFGSYYDLYRIVVDTEAEWVVEMNSTEVDSYLILFDANGEQVAFNDDYDDTTTDARIDAMLSPGCYIVMATSFGPADTGSYTVFFF